MNKPPLLEVVVTARPSWARVKSLVDSYVSIAGASNVRVSLLGPALSQRYGDISTQIRDDITVNHFPSLHEGDGLADVALSCLDGSSSLVRYWVNSRPDCILVIADRTETLGVSVAAGIMQIPLIHLQGGEITGSIDDKIRDTNTKLADMHLTTNSHTLERIISMGESPDRVFEVGCPSIDLAHEIKHSPEISNKDGALFSSDIGGVGENFSLRSPYGIIMFHPDTTDVNGSILWLDKIRGLIENSELNWFWFWPNPDHGSSAIAKYVRKLREETVTRRTRFVINLSPENFLSLAANSEIMVGNSSFGIREASFLGIKTLNLGSRQNGRQRAENVLDLSLSDDLLEKFHERLAQDNPAPSELYGDGHAGQYAAQIIADWTPSLKVRAKLGK